MRKSIVRIIVAALIAGSVVGANVSTSFAGGHGSGGAHCNGC